MIVPMSMLLDLTPEVLAEYRATAQRRSAEAERKKAARRERAWDIARQAAAYLKDTFGATEVLVFGSLAHGHWYSLTSDIDLAAWGIPSEDYFLAVARLQDISPEYAIDLVRLENCSAESRQRILEEGKVI